MNDFEQTGDQIEEMVEEGFSTETDNEEPSTDEMMALTQIGTQPLPISYSPSTLEAVVAGHMYLEITPSVTEQVNKLEPGRILEAGRATLTPAGSATNTGLALHRLGITTHLMGKIGNDVFGRALLDQLTAQDAELVKGMVISPETYTAYSLNLSLNGNDRYTFVASGGNDDFAAQDVSYELLEPIGLFHLGTPMQIGQMHQQEGEELITLYSRLKMLDVTTSLALSMPDIHSTAAKADWSAILQGVLPYVDICLPGIEELLFMFRRQQFEKLSAKAGKKDQLLDLVTPELVSEMGQMLLEMGARVVGIRLGYRGLYLCTAPADTLSRMGRAQPAKLLPWVDRELWAPCFTTEVTTTTGSGNATIAGFLMGLLRGMGPEGTLAAACAVGACSTEGPDTLSGLKSWPETMERIALGWPRLIPEKKKHAAFDIASFKWRWDQTYELWVGPGDIHYV